MLLSSAASEFCQESAIISCVAEMPRLTLLKLLLLVFLYTELRNTFAALPIRTRSPSLLIPISFSVAVSMSNKTSPVI